jgi:hypothetical protein
LGAFVLEDDFFSSGLVSAYFKFDKILGSFALESDCYYFGFDYSGLEFYIRLEGFFF